MNVERKVLIELESVKRNYLKLWEKRGRTSLAPTNFVVDNTIYNHLTRTGYTNARQLTPSETRRFTFSSSRLMLNQPSTYLSFSLNLIYSKAAEIWETYTGGTIPNYFLVSTHKAIH